MFELKIKWSCQISVHFGRTSIPIYLQYACNIFPFKQNIKFNVNRFMRKLFPNLLIEKYAIIISLYFTQVTYAFQSESAPSGL